jgi:pSer/pThr/pTyr-binding forkhead associated (FHA) protein
MAKFVVFYNNELLKTYELDEPVISIGRLPENTISIANMGVSRRHVKIEEDADRSYILSDLNSLNGTFVNGKKVKKTQLHSGDKIAIGKYSILYEEVSGNRSYVVEKEKKNDEPVKPEAREYLGSSDFSYVHRTTEPRMRAVPEKNTNNTMQPVDILPEEHLQQPSTSVLIETNKHVVYKIDKKYMTMGSSDDDDIFISGFMIGPGHVTIDVQSDGIFINSTKIMGKFKINGKPKRSHLLQHKDRIEVGSSTFRFMENG